MSLTQVTIRFRSQYNTAPLMNAHSSVTVTMVVADKPGITLNSPLSLKLITVSPVHLPFFTTDANCQLLAIKIQKYNLQHSAVTIYSIYGGLT